MTTDKIREAFERLAVRRGYSDSFDRDGDDYKESILQELWVFYRAALSCDVEMRAQAGQPANWPQAVDESNPHGDAYAHGFRAGWNSALKDASAALAASPAQGAAAPAVVEEPGQLDPRHAADQARQLLRYCQSFNGQPWGGLDESVDRKNLAVALDNLEDAAAMLLNLSERVASPQAQQPHPQGAEPEREIVLPDLPDLPYNGGRWTTKAVIAYAEEAVRADRLWEQEQKAREGGEV